MCCLYTFLHLSDLLVARKFTYARIDQNILVEIFVANKRVALSVMNIVVRNKTTG